MNSRHGSYLPEIAAASAMFFYGTSFVATKFALESFNPITIITIRNVISGVMLLGFLLLKGGRSQLPARSDIKTLLVIALFQPFLYFLSETYGISLVDASLAAIIIATIPVFTPLVTRFFFDEGLNRYNYAGLGISSAGVAVIVLTSRSADGMAAHPAGVLLMFIAVFSAVGYSIAVKKSSVSLSAVTITAMQNCLGALYFLQLFFAVDFSHALSSRPELLSVLSVIYLAVFPSSAAFILMNYGIRTIGPTRTMVFTNLIPAVTAVLSLFLLNELFTPEKIIGMAVILCGVLLSQRGSSKTAKEVIIDR